MTEAAQNPQDVLDETERGLAEATRDLNLASRDLWRQTALILNAVGDEQGAADADQQAQTLEATDEM